MEQQTTCQWCESPNTFESGHSPMCAETQYKCRECNGETWETKQRNYKKILDKQTY